MDLTQLRTFVAVAQEGHLTRAAERLHISQPAASAHIRALEAHFRLQLFGRTNRGLELNVAGRQLADIAQRVLDGVLELESAARELEGSVGGRLALGVNADPALSRVGALVAWLRDRHPLLTLEIEMRSSQATRQGVQAGELDAGFMLGSHIGKGLGAFVLQRLEYRIAAPAAWSSRVLRATWQTLAELPWIVTAPGTSNQEMRDTLLAPQGVHARAGVEANNDLLLRSLIAEGLGIGLVRADLAAEGERNGLFSLCPLGSATTNLLFVYPSARGDDPLIHALLDGVHVLWPDAPDASTAPA